MNADADVLTIYATDVRYPDDFYMPPLEETKESIEIAEKAMDFIKEKLHEGWY